MIICVCYNVNSEDIQIAITEQGCSTVEDVCEKLNCCKNCKSCEDHIQEIIDETLTGK